MRTFPVKQKFCLEYNQHLFFTIAIPSDGPNEKKFPC